MVHVLAADVGGTKTDVALYAVGPDGGLRVVRDAQLRSAQYVGLEAALAAFLRPDDPPLAAAAFGLPGPVIDGAVVTTNLPWHVRGAAVSRALAGVPVRLLNDLEATAYGALFLPPERLHPLNPGVPRAGHRAVIAAGTGLGQAYAFWDGARYHAAATEGGHVDFAARNDVEERLRRHLEATYGHVSVERVISGPGLHAIFRFLAEVEGRAVAPAVRARMAEADPSAVVAEAALAGTCETCAAAVDLFVHAYGAQAGNLALTVMATGGVYVGGGMVVHLLPRIVAGGFVDAFVAKGRFEHLLREIPVWAITDPRTARLGAGHAALALVG